MWRIIYKFFKRILKPYPGIKLFLKPIYRRSRTVYLRRRYPEGAFLTCNGAEIFCDFSNKNFSWYDGDSDYLAYELQVFLSLFEMRRPDVVLDIGAHWGLYPAYISHHAVKNKPNKIICVEPDVYNARILSRTIANIRNLDVQQLDAAISSNNGYLNLYSGEGACSQTYESPGAMRGREVEAITLDSLIETHLSGDEVVTHIKVDIDGYEPALFMGGQRSLGGCKPIIMMEFWAKGLNASGVDIMSYWNMLHENYHVNEACYTKKALLPLSLDDLSYLSDKTMNGVTNLVLIPKATLNKPQ